MVDALRLAGADAVAAAQSANAMCGIRSKADKDPTLLEVYGTSLHSHLNREKIEHQRFGSPRLKDYEGEW